jgi:class 3 adenylate cyclase/tetratricopeptide (TPR) repeat protein
MVDVSRWLAEQGLGHHAEAFAENGIAGDILCELTDSDLKQLGLNLGDRKRLLKAIAALDAAYTQVRTEAAEPTATPAVPREAERRQLTVLFCDLVGSTELATRLDPEDMGTVIGTYHRATAAVIELFEGHVARYLGDCVLAYFGWPKAHEDDAERAVRAGLGLVDAVARLEPHEEVRLQVRVGVATGHVVVGDLVGEGAARDEAVVGETPNLAARLQTLAAPESVVICQATRRLVRGLFELEDLGPRRLKGFAEPVTAWRVEGEACAEGRFEARQTAGLTPLVGREEEIALLLRRWEQAQDGDGQVVLLSGEPGIGKSRIVREVRERLAAEPHLRLTHQCSPYHQASPLRPVVEHLERAGGFARDDPPEARLDKLESVLARGTDRIDEALPLIAALLGIPTGARYPALELTPERQKQRTLEALLDQLEGLATEQPVLVVHEDVHWIDPSTLEFLGLVIERIRQLPVLVLITFRPEFTPPWTGQPHLSTLTMSRLGRRQVADLVARVTGGKPLPAAIVEQIVARTDGVPLFVEELTKTVLESGLLADAGDRYELSGPLPTLAIPATLHDSLMARLDRLASVKEVAQTGAVIGREFSHDLLAAVSPLSEADLSSALDQLVTSELALRPGSPPEATYSFKHALVQDAAYESLLKSKRQQLHARIAEVLEGGSPDLGETGPEVLARHLTDAGLPQRAIPYWRRAGELAAGRSANVESIAHLSKGLELIGTLENAAEHLDEELAFRMAIGGPLIAIRGYAAPEVELTYSRASALCEQLGRAAELFPALRGLWGYYQARGELRRAHQLAERLVVLAEEQETPLRRALARRARGTALFLFGQFADAMAALNEGIAIDDTVSAWEDPAHLLLYTERAGVMCRLYSALALWYLGFPDRALERVEAGLALGRRLAHVHSLAFALIWAARLHNLRREFAAARRRSEATIDLARAHPLPQRLAEATCAGASLWSASVSE